MGNAAKLRKVEAVTEVPFIDLKRGFRDRADQIVHEWSKVLADSEFVGGKRVALLEKELSTRLGVPGVTTCANGTDALILALQACGVKPGMKVALPNLTFWATYEAVVQIGALPVLIDIHPDDLQMDFDEFKLAQRKIGFEAALLPHLFGWGTPALDDYRAFCAEKKISLIEDGAQAYGVRWRERSIFEGSKIATLSFYPAKVLGGAMDGGAVVGSDPSLTEACRVLGNHGRSKHYSYSHVGWNSRMGGLQAAFLLEVIGTVDKAIESRRKALKLYETLLSEPIRSGRIRFWKAPSGYEGNGYLAVMTVQGASGEALQKKLSSVGVGCGRTYPETIADQSCVPSDVLRVSELSRSRAFARDVINLPLFAHITEEECHFAAEKFLAILEEMS